jgi:hypothetical protein
MGWMVNATPWLPYPSGTSRYALCRRLGRHQSRSGRVRKISPPPGFRTPDRPARSDSLYRLRYPDPQPSMNNTLKYSWNNTFCCYYTNLWIESLFRSQLWVIFSRNCGLLLFITLWQKSATGSVESSPRPSPGGPILLFVLPFTTMPQKHSWQYFFASWVKQLMKK